MKSFDESNPLIDFYSFTRLENNMRANLTSSTSLVLKASDMDTFKINVKDCKYFNLVQ